MRVVRRGHTPHAARSFSMCEARNIATTSPTPSLAEPPVPSSPSARVRASRAISGLGLGARPRTTPSQPAIFQDMTLKPADRVPATARHVSSPADAASPATPHPPGPRMHRPGADVAAIAPLLPAARRMANKRGYTPADRDDLQGDAVLALLEQLRRGHDLELGAALGRMYGAISDSLRKQDPLKRITREHVQCLKAAEHTLRARLRREPTSEELAREAKLTVAQARRAWRAEAAAKAALHPPFEAPDSAPLPDELLDHRRLLARLSTAIEGLGPRLRSVVVLYFFEELKLREIGRVLGVGEARASQLLAEARTELRALLEAPTQRK